MSEANERSQRSLFVAGRDAPPRRLQRYVQILQEFLGLLAFLLVVFEELPHQLGGLLLAAAAEPLAADALVVDALCELVVVARQQVGVQFVDGTVVGLAAEFALLLRGIAAPRCGGLHLVVPLLGVVE